MDTPKSLWIYPEDAETLNLGKRKEAVEYVPFTRLREAFEAGWLESFKFHRSDFGTSKAEAFANFLKEGK
jgi:hypothetical protein